MHCNWLIREFALLLDKAAKHRLTSSDEERPLSPTQRRDGKRVRYARCDKGETWNRTSPCVRQEGSASVCHLRSEPLSKRWPVDPLLQLMGIMPIDIHIKMLIKNASLRLYRLPWITTASKSAGHLGSTQGWFNPPPHLYPSS
jgi:hypothetical protein